MNSVTNESGRRWRILAYREGGEKIELENEGAFDELVLDDWFHIEQKDTNLWWLRIGDARLFVTVSNTESPTVDVERGCYASIKGVTQAYKLD
jgi:hypothetical protein